MKSVEKFMTKRPFLPSYIFGALLIVGASLPSGSIERLKDVHEFFDILFSQYTLHFFGFGIFAALLGWGYYQRKHPGILVKSGIVSFSFGLLVEAYHYVLPYRSAEMVDVVLDGAGIAAALTLFWAFVVRRRPL